MNHKYSEQNKHYNVLSRALKYLATHQKDQPSLGQLAAQSDLSEYHFQRVFKEWVGISPKQFLQYLTKEHAKRSLASHSVLDSAYESGLSSASRLHDLMITWEAMTPGEFKHAGRGLNIRYSVHPSPFGLCFIASTSRGICHLTFIDLPEQQKPELEMLQNNFPEAMFLQDEEANETYIKRIFSQHSTSDKPLHLLLKGSPFQIKVWEALLRIPSGTLCSYQRLARLSGNGNAVRAAASAIAKNNIALLIPCHRIIRNTGEFNHYRWGAERKMAIIAWEANASCAALPQN